MNCELCCNVWADCVCTRVQVVYLMYIVCAACILCVQVVGAVCILCVRLYV